MPVRVARRCRRAATRACARGRPARRARSARSARPRAPARRAWGSGRRAGRAGSASLRGAPWTSRRGSPLPGAVERREDGERPAVLASAAGRRRRRTGRGGGSPRRRAERSAVSTRRSRAIAKGDTSRAKRTALAPVSRASVDELVLRTPAADHEVGAAVAQRLAQLAQEPSRNAARGPEGKRPCSSASSSTNTGTTRSAERAAAVSGGWSCDAQVAPEPDDLGAGHRRRYGRRSLATTRPPA